MNILEIIKARRSIRKFKKEAIPEIEIQNILEAGRWAPSGLNNQPWKFMVLDSDKKNELANFTKYSHIVKACDKTILVFFDKEASYNHEKDLLAIGACIQNMLLYIQEKGLGACWLGEILNQREDIYKFLDLNNNLELEAVIALGVPDEDPQRKVRKSIKDLTVK